jgi:hypothetical protein
LGVGRCDAGGGIVCSLDCYVGEDDILLYGNKLFIYLDIVGVNLGKIFGEREDFG